MDIIQRQVNVGVALDPDLLAALTFPIERVIDVAHECQVCRIRRLVLKGETF